MVLRDQHFTPMLSVYYSLQGNYVADPREYSGAYIYCGTIETNCSACDACGVLAHTRAARMAMQIRDTYTPSGGEPTFSLNRNRKGHPVMPDEANDGERWIIDSGSGFHLVGGNALTDTDSLLIDITYSPGSLETPSHYI